MSSKFGCVRIGPCFSVACRFFLTVLQFVRWIYWPTNSSLLLQGPWSHSSGALVWLDECYVVKHACFPAGEGAFHIQL